MNKIITLLVVAVIAMGCNWMEYGSLKPKDCKLEIRQKPVLVNDTSQTKLNLQPTKCSVEFEIDNGNWGITGFEITKSLVKISGKMKPNYEVESPDSYPGAVFSLEFGYHFLGASR